MNRWKVVVGKTDILSGNHWHVHYMYLILEIKYAALHYSVSNLQDKM
jgi:hypothetical protein